MFWLSNDATEKHLSQDVLKNQRRPGILRGLLM